MGAFLIPTAIGNTIGRTDVFRPEVHAAFAEVAMLTVKGKWATVLLRGLFAGWIIAMMVWMMPASDSSRPAIIIFRVGPESRSNYL